MKREDFIEAKSRLIGDLEARYVKESGILDSMYLDWSHYYDLDDQLVEEAITIFKVRSASVENDNIFIDTVDQGFVSVDYTDFVDELEEGSGDPSSVIRFYGYEKNCRCRGGLQISKEDGDIQIDEYDYTKILEIMYGGDCSVLTGEDRIRELRKYLKTCGFEPMKKRV